MSPRRAAIRGTSRLHDPGGRQPSLCAREIGARLPPSPILALCARVLPAQLPRPRQGWPTPARRAADELCTRTNCSARTEHNDAYATQQHWRRPPGTPAGAPAHLLSTVVHAAGTPRARLLSTQRGEPWPARAAQHRIASHAHARALPTPVSLLRSSPARTAASAASSHHFDANCP